MDKELTCSICTEIFTDPVTFLKCLHTTCGACAKRWFSTQAVPTCPECRGQVVETKTHTTLVNLLNEYVKHHPDKARTAEEVAELRQTYKPGDRVLVAGPADSPPPTPPGVAAYSLRNVGQASQPRGLSANPAPFMGHATFGNLRTLNSPPRLDPIALQTPSFQDFLGPMGLPHSPGHGIPGAYPHRSPSLRSPPGTASAAANLDPLLMSFQRLLQSDVDANTPRSPTLGGPQPSRISRLISDRRDEGMVVRCNSCQGTVTNDTHMECCQCENIHLCLRCFRQGSNARPRCPGVNASHRFRYQRVIQRRPRPSIQTGIFCSICNEWCDADRSEGDSDHCLFWNCQSCNDGDWNYCNRCINRGAHCTHMLEQWTNNRMLRRPPNAILRGNTAHPSCLIPMHELRTGVTSSDRLRAAGYLRSTAFSTNCDICRRVVPNEHPRLHCNSCENGELDVCLPCHSIWNSGPSDTYTCRAGHEMALVCDGPANGMRQAILMPAAQPPIAPVELGRSGDGWVSTALIPHWPDDSFAEGEGDSDTKLEWAVHGVLQFPKGAEISRTVTAFWETGPGDGWRAYGWGSYCGRTGIFPMDNVRMS